MGRPSIASLILAKLKELDPPDDRSRYLVVYDFSVTASRHIPPAFYKNLERIRRELGDGMMVQKSVIECNKYETAVAVALLAKHYGARVKVYRVADEAPEVDGLPPCLP